jgi:hypothetical protein
MTETKASTELFQTNPEIFTRDKGEKPIHNMIIFSILSYFVFEQHDWQTKKDVVVYSNRIVTQTSYISKPHSCTLVTYDAIRKWLSDSGNIFSTFKWYSPFNSICLPPNTSISVTLSSVTVSNPFCTIVFDVERSGGFAGRPTRRGDNPILENGNETFWTWTTPIRVTTLYSRWRAQHRDKQKYQDWSQNLVESVRGWFGTVTDHSAVAIDADEENSGSELGNDGNAELTRRLRGHWGARIDPLPTVRFTRADETASHDRPPVRQIR